MTLGAFSHVTLADVKQGECCGRAYDGCNSVIQRVVKISSTVSWALPGQIRSHAVLVIARNTRGGGLGIS